jgi:hypothetical protein
VNLSRPLVAGVLLLGLCRLTALGDALSPKIVCYSIGVSDTPDIPLAPPKASAELFATNFAHLFPGAEIHLFTSPAHPATSDVVEKILHVDIPALPRYSSVVFYFAGHGIHDDANTNYDDDLHLLLAGAATTNYQTHSLNFAELVDALSRTRMVTGIAVLDCCSSGAPVDADTRTGRLVRQAGDPLGTSPRFVYFLATGTGAQETYSGKFTTNFLNSWKAGSLGNSCLKPDGLRDLLVGQADKDPVDKGFRVPDVEPPGVNWCLSTLGKPMTLLWILPKNGFRGSVPATFVNLGFTEQLRFNSGLDYFFSAFVPKNKDLAIKVDYQFSHPMLTIPATNLTSDILVLQTDGTTIEQVGQDTRLTGVSTAQLTQIADKAISEAGMAPQTSEFLELVGRNLARNSDSALAKQYFSMAASSPASVEQAARLKLLVNFQPGKVSEDLVKISPKYQARFLSDVDLVYGTGSAKEGWDALLEDKRGTSQETFFKTRSYVSAKANGDKKRSNELFNELLSKFANEDPQKEKELSKIANLPDDQVKMVPEVFADTPKEFQNHIVVPVTLQPKTFEINSAEIPQNWTKDKANAIHQLIQ